MPAMAGTERMWMRFDLFARVAPATDFAAVKAPSSGVWQKSAPGRASSGFVFTQRVAGADARPASYRAQVRFRWYGNGGKAAALGHAHERDLQAARPAPGPARRRARRRPRPAPEQATYALDVRNAGRTAAGRFDVVLTVGGAEQPPEHVSPGSRRRPPRP